VPLVRAFGDWTSTSVGGGAPRPYVPLTPAPTPAGPQPAAPVAVTVVPAAQSTLPPGGSIPVAPPGTPWTGGVPAPGTYAAPFLPGAYSPPPAAPPAAAHKIFGMSPIALAAAAGGGLLIFLIARRFSSS
jgi:hypothetical protein